MAGQGKVVISFSCKQNVLEPAVVPYFGDHALAKKPIFMDDNARSHRSRAVRACLQENAITTLLWPVLSLRELELALHREWQNLTMRQIRQYTGGMRQSVEAVI